MKTWKNNLKIFLMFACLSVVLLYVLGCGGGGGSGENPVGTTPSTTPTVLEKNVDATVSLPTGSTLKVETLNILTNLQNSAVNSDGSFVAKSAVSATNGASTLVMATNNSGNLVLLKSFQADGANQSTPVSVETTAEAFVLNDPIFLKFSDSSRSLARDKYLAHGKKSELLASIENAIKNDPNDPLNPDSHSDLYSLAAEITIDIINQLPSPRFSAMPNIMTAMSADNYVGVKDDSAQSDPKVILVNNSYVFYSVTVKKDSNIVNSFGGPAWDLPKKKLVELKFDWPPYSFNAPKEVDCSSGDGNLSFEFTKDTPKTVRYLILSAIGDIIGFPYDFPKIAIKNLF